MTVMTITAEDATDAFEHIERLTFREPKQYIFRGQRDSKWQLCTTYSRHVKSPPRDVALFSFEDMLKAFYTNLSFIGIKVPRQVRKGNLRARLEYARHFGIPSPVIDFTRSPFIAMFFAFNGVRAHDAKDGDTSCLYVLNIGQLALIRTKSDLRANNSKRFDEIHNEFLHSTGPMFSAVYETNQLKFIDYPASWNRRMQRQMGCFLYDSMDYARAGFKDESPN
jgi:FRG domain